MTRLLTRRHFLQAGLFGAGFVTAGVTSGSAAARHNPYAYPTDHLRKTDPKLLNYEETARFRCPRAEPRRIAVGPDGRVYLAAGKTVCVLEPDGTPIRELAFSEPVRCLTVAPDATLYVGLRRHVEVFSSKQDKSWESAGERAWLTGLSVGDDDLFAADAGNRVVLRYDRSGKLLRRIGEKDPARKIPGFMVPSPYFDVRLAPDGLLRVTNTGRHRVEIYTREGDFEGSWGKPSAAIDGFFGCCNPIHLALLDDGRCVTCEKGLPRVKIYSPTGEFESVVAGIEAFPENAKAGPGNEKFESTRTGLDAAVDKQGRIYVLDVVAADVRVMKRKAAAPS